MGASTGDRRRAVLRADASSAIGLGHVTRSLALGEQLAAAGWSVTLCASGVPLGYRPINVELVVTAPGPDAAPVLALDPDLVVVDGYDFTAPFFSELERAGMAVAVIDDDGATPARCPVAVVNQNPHADPRMYRHLDGDPLLLLGMEHCLLRREVVAAACGPPSTRNDSVLVAFGGSDPRGLTAPVARALAAAGHDVRVAVGEAHADREAVLEALGGIGGIGAVRSADYVAELASAGVAVLAAGSSMWEAACLGTPTVGVVVADNQRRPAEAAREQGLVADVVPADERLLAALPSVIETVRSSGMVPTARPSPQGARRVATVLDGVVGGPVRLRPATIADAPFLLALRSDPEVDRQSFGPAPTVDDHRRWLAAAVADPARRILVVEDGGRPIGQVRLDGDAASSVETVSIALVEGARGRGLARRALRAAHTLATGDLVARIRTGNDASIAAFAAAGFGHESSADGEVVMRWRRPPAAGLNRERSAG